MITCILAISTWPAFISISPNKYLGNRSSFFVPDDIEIKLKNGNATLYDRQYARFCHLVPEDVRLIPLVEMIHRYHRVYEQEGYISSIVFR